MEIGQLFGYWRVKEKCHIGRYPAAVAQCVCGTLRKLKESYLKSGLATKCRQCCIRDKSQVKTGMRFGRWTVLLPRLDKRNHRHWDVLCDCGTKATRRAESLRNGSAKECKNCWKDKDKPEAVKTRMWNSLVNNAKLRDIEVHVTKEDIFELLEKQSRKCALSGKTIVVSQKTSEYQKGWTTASVDRIDSSRGYTIDNIQWVHKKINIIKMDLDQEDFIHLCHQVSKHNPRDV